MSFGTLTELGMNSETAPRDRQDDVIENRSCGAFENEKDYFIERDGEKFAGMHLLVDLWGASHLDDLSVTEQALRDAAEASGATILHCHLHRFTPNGGISGVLVLAESHISIHTWPERGFAALDVFMCGDCDPYHGVPVLEAAFAPREMVLCEQRRGRVSA